MKKWHFVPIFTGIIVLLFSCKKGDTGTAGVNGANGYSVLNGSGVPSDSAGTNGDFYLDTLTQTLYGPKTDGAWGSGVLLKGNANVVTDTFTVSGSGWQYGKIYYVGTSPGVSTGFTTKSFVHEVPGITQDLLNSGLVQAYYTPAPNLSASNWTPLPYSFITYGGYAYNYATETSPGKMSFYFYFSKVSEDAPDLQSYLVPDLKFKIVMIAGKIVGERNKQQLSGPVSREN